MNEQNPTVIPTGTRFTLAEAVGKYQLSLAELDVAVHRGQMEYVKTQNGVVLEVK